MSFKLTAVTVADDGRLLVTLHKKDSGTNTQLWLTPPSPAENLTFAQIAELAKQAAAKEYAC